MLTEASHGQASAGSLFPHRWFLAGRRSESASEQVTDSLLGAPHQSPVHVQEVQGPAEIRQRLLELGFTPGCEVTVLAQGPLGGPLAVSCRGAIVALRRREAGCIRVG